MEQVAKWSDLTGQDRPGKPWLDGLPRMIFVSDMSDMLSAAISFDYILDEVIWNVLNEDGMKHRWLWLTKRPKRMAEFSRWLRRDTKVQWPRNLWVGTSVTSQANVNRIRELLMVGNEYTTRFVSLEPQWEAIQMGELLQQIDWLIQGGESGTVKHPFDVAWAEQVRKECEKAGVAYFLKQLGAHVVDQGSRLRLRSKKGVDGMEWPTRLRTRQIPG
jgi:protein gp37